jgi:hypothetical protein
LAAGYAASACGRGGQTTARRKSRGRSPGEAGTHRSKGIGMSFAHTKACAAGIPVLQGREDVTIAAFEGDLRRIAGFAAQV